MDFLRKFDRNSGCMLSGPGALPAFNDFNAVSTSIGSMGLHRSSSAPGEFHSDFKSVLTCRVASRSGFLNFPFWRRHEAIWLALGPIGRCCYSLRSSQFV